MERSSARPALEPIRGGLSPAYLLIPVFLGLFIGLGIGLKDRIAGGQVDRDQSYIALAATLYGQNPTSEVAADLRQRLVSLGISDPSQTVLAMSDEYKQSRDRDLQRQADGLRMFGEALGGVTGPIVKVPTVAPTMPPTFTPLALLPADEARPSPTPPRATPTPEAVALAIATQTPTVEPTSAPTEEPSPTPTVKKPTATPTKKPATPTKKPATATPKPLPGTTINKYGIADTGTTKNVLVRTAPNTRGTIIVSIPNGSKVYVMKAVSGEAIIKNSPTWYYSKVTVSSGKVIQGYIYGLLVKLTN